MGGCETCNVVTPRYNGRKNRLNIEDIPSNYGCDGANSTYTPHCDQWYFISHCLALESGTLDLSAYDNATKDMINAEISAASCSGHLGLAAYKAYAADPTWTRAPTPQPTNFPTPAPTPEPTVYGDLSFTMDSAAAASVAAQFIDPSTTAAVSAAFAKTIAASMPGKVASHYSSSTVAGVEVEEVTITSITASRRLMMKSRALQSGSLDVSYEITAHSEVLEYAVTSITTVNTTEFAASLTTELQQVDGLSSVTVDSMATPAEFSDEAPAEETTEAPADHHDHDHDHETTAEPEPSTAAPTKAATTATPTTAVPVEDQSFTTLAAFGLALAVVGA